MPRRVISGISTYWTGYGHGPRSALLIHCSLAHSGAWGALAGALSGALSMTAMDLPGHGRSGPWAADETREIQAVSTELVAGLLSPHGEVDLIGHSFGATVALRLAVEHPRRIRSLTLIEPVFFAAAYRDDPTAEERHRAEQTALLALLEAGDRAGAAEEFIRVWGGGAPWASLSERHRAQLAAQIHLIKAADPALQEDVGGILRQLKQVQCPVLLLEGSESHWIMPKILSALDARLKQAHRAIVVGAGHMVPLTHPDQVAREILALLQAS